MTQVIWTDPALDDLERIARPYIIRYRIERDRVYILRVRHSARRR